MTIEEVARLYEAFDSRPIGDEYLDSIFQTDTSAVYYRFLYALCQLIQPTRTVELGVSFGRATAHLAAAWPPGEVCGVDVSALNLPDILTRYFNVRLIRGSSDSPEVLGEIEDRSVDICFFDTVHDGEYLSRELELWTPKLRKEAVLLFDDIHMFPSMTSAWNRIKLPKIELPDLHYTGFGAAIAP